MTVRVHNLLRDCCKPNGPVILWVCDRSFLVKEDCSAVLPILWGEARFPTDLKIGYIEGQGKARANA